jgi:Carboxymuconolactone decarboxylase family
LRDRFIQERGYWNPFWDGLLQLDPTFFEAYLNFSSVPWQNGVLEPKMKELIYIAIDAATTHLYEPGLRQRIRNAIRFGASKEEVMEVLELVSVLGIHACTLGVIRGYSRGGPGDVPEQAGRHRQTSASSGGETPVPESVDEWHVQGGCDPADRHRRGRARSARHPGQLGGTGLRRRRHYQPALERAGGSIDEEVRSQTIQSVASISPLGIIGDTQESTVRCSTCRRRLKVRDRTGTPPERRRTHSMNRGTCRNQASAALEAASSRRPGYGPCREMMTNLLGLQAQPALVGGGFGIGAATARLLAQTGARAVVEEAQTALGV